MHWAHLMHVKKLSSVPELTFTSELRCAADVRGSQGRPPVERLSGPERAQRSGVGSARSELSFVFNRESGSGMHGVR